MSSMLYYSVAEVTKRVQPALFHIKYLYCCLSTAFYTYWHIDCSTRYSYASWEKMQGYIACGPQENEHDPFNLVLLGV